jgi:hypothetical protein
MKSINKPKSTIMKQPIQRRCKDCNKRAIVREPSNGFCHLYCTLRNEFVSPYEWCKNFFYGGMDKSWIR